ncbi:hypothetical protein [Streptomyces qinzhouensis]|uniref:hypothetical protein n=1 Tax=Streptomyces qinzhouensis TaxID=2599401 RepID=UPI0016474DA4|nr:hypothetical protein [Streptomyces qinzhouensis]
MSLALRPLVTAAAAGALLCALWFVPSANATTERPPADRGYSSTGSLRDTGSTAGVPLRLADTGSVDTTPYLLGGAAFLAVGISFVTYAVRRGHSAPDTI